MAVCGLAVAWWAPSAANGDDAPQAAGVAVAPAETRMKSDVAFLAADEQEGRAPGTKGIEASADYIAGVFKKAGLTRAPGAEGYFQPFMIPGPTTLGKDPLLVFNGPDGATIKPEFQSDFSPLAIGKGGLLEKTPIVFAGYGITAKKGAGAARLDYDDYAGLDVTGKAVLILRREPQQNDAASPFNGKENSTYATFQHKASNAFQHGAAAIILVNNLAGLVGEQDRPIGFTQAGPSPLSRVPFLMMTREQADRLMSAAGEPSLSDLEKKIDEDLKPRSRVIPGWHVTAKIGIDSQTIETKNVVGVIEGAGPHARETVIIGGHYDHLGRGGMLSGSLAFFSKDIHNGADDNASGTSMVLELARRLGSRPDPPARRIVFMAFSGEERGLLGSQYYVDHPLFPLEQTVMMINCDMVGRLSGNSELTMVGTGTATGIAAIVESLGQSAGLKIKKVAGVTDAFGGSDHESFYRKDIPVLFAFTGLHGDYHRPSDDTNLINFSGMARIADYLELIALDVIRRPRRPEYVRVVAASNPHGGPGQGPGRASVSLGVFPDYTYEAGDGLRITGVRNGGPADQAGLKDGDRIVRCGDNKVGTIQDYMETMTHFKPGEKLSVVVVRDGKEVTLNVTLAASRQQ